MASARVEFDNAGMSAVLVGPDIRESLATVAATGKAYAESISPRRSGHYAGSFEVRADTIEFDGSPRAAATLINTAGYAAAVEWGYRRGAADPSPTAHRVLGRTLDHLTELRP
jgi:hypothetical protein